MRKEEIERRQPWQSYIETTFNIQRRMADYYFAKPFEAEQLLSGVRALLPQRRRG